MILAKYFLAASISPIQPDGSLTENTNPSPQTSSASSLYRHDFALRLAKSVAGALISTTGSVFVALTRLSQLMDSHR